MVVQMSWEDQGRQYHMWFGHGTTGNKAAKAAPSSSVVGQSTADRVLALAYGALASLPAARRGQAEAQYNSGTLPRLKEAMTAWLRATTLNEAAFASRLFGRSADDPVVRDLHSAALGAATATSHDDLREAAGKLARAMEAVGIDRWPHSVADAQERARDPATQAAIEKSRRPPAPGRDAIRPAYPLETAIGVATAGLTGGAAAAARAARGALLKQFLPEGRSPTGNAAAPSASSGQTSATAPSPPAANRAEFERYQQVMHERMAKPVTTDPALSHAMDEMYRDGASVGSGSTAAAVRQERATGGPVGGRMHTQKAESYVRFLERWLQKNPTASPGDRAAAENVLRDLRDALAGN